MLLWNHKTEATAAMSGDGVSVELAEAYRRELGQHEVIVKEAGR